MLAAAECCRELTYLTDRCDVKPDERLQIPPIRGFPPGGAGVEEVGAVTMQASRHLYLKAITVLPLLIYLEASEAFRRCRQTGQE
jgi:hypothetical protein